MFTFIKRNYRLLFFGAFSLVVVFLIYIIGYSIFFIIDINKKLNNLSYDKKKNIYSEAISKNKGYSISFSKRAENFWHKECPDDSSNIYKDVCLSNLLDKTVLQRKQKVDDYKKYAQLFDDNEFMVGNLTKWKKDFSAWKENYEATRNLWCDVFNLGTTREWVYDLCKLEFELITLEELDQLPNNNFSKIKQ